MDNFLHLRRALIDLGRLGSPLETGDHGIGLDSFAHTTPLAYRKGVGD